MRAGLGSAAPARAAVRGASVADAFLAAARDALERHERLDFDIAAGSAPSAPAAEEPLEEAAAEVEITEERFEVDAVEQVPGRNTGEAARVVFGTLFRVRENRIRLGDLLEALFGTGLLVAVRVVLQRERTKGVLDRARVGVTRDTEDFVVIAPGQRASL